MSAICASPADSGTDVVDKVPLDKVRALQHTLYRTAKADPGRRFHALWDKVLRRDVLWRAWVAVRTNNGAPGIDRTTLDWIEKEYGIDRLPTNCPANCGTGRIGRFRRGGCISPSRERPTSGHCRFPAVRDRVVQAALKIVLEPIFEADFAPCSFGFRPKRGQHDALQVLTDETWRGRRWVAETDVADCFSAIPHNRLLQAVEERVVDQSVLKLLRAMLRAGVMESGIVRHPDTGTPQGGVISPLMCNVYLNRLDRDWDTRTYGVLVRFADDLLVVCKSRQQAQAALTRLRALLADLGLAPKEAKTRIVELAVGGEGFDFLGFHHRMVRSRGTRGRRGVAFLARWPSDRAMRRARDRITELTVRSRLRLPVEEVVKDLNRFLRGWANYFRYGHCTDRFHKIEQHARDRLALFIGKRHKRGRGFGWSVLAYKSRDFCGLLSLDGAAIAPRADKPWREKLNAGGERRR